MGSTGVPPCSRRSCLSPRQFRGLCIFWIYETAFTSLVSLTGWFVHFLQGVVEPCLTSDGDDTFKSQSNRKPVCDFIRILLMDSLLNVSANTNTHPLSLLLEVKALTSITSANYLLWFVTLRIMLKYQHTDNTYILLYTTCIPTEKRLLIVLLFCKTLISPEGATLCSVTKWGRAKFLLVKSFTTRRERTPIGQILQISVEVFTA